jgi:hypothetical protein
MNAQTIFDFTTNANASVWTIVDDGVMGGKSAGEFAINKEGHGVFEGEISLKNNGGFSSLRYGFEKMDVSKYTQVVLYICGDGKDYQFRLKGNANERYSYISTFNTTGEWQEISIPLADMAPSFRGRKLEIPNFNQDFIEEIVFLIGNKKEESFKLMIKSITLQ